ncbi:protein of unknown function [Pseudomonas mediterranea]
MWEITYRGEREPNSVIIRLIPSMDRLMEPYWIWQQPDWPNFHWQPETLAAPLRECVQTQGQLLGMTGAVTASLNAQNELDALLQNIVTSSAIEGEQLNVGSVRSSLARRLGLERASDTPVSPRSEGLANLLLDATRHFSQPLTVERLLEWHEWLFPEQASDLAHQHIRVGSLRGTSRCKWCRADWTVPLLISRPRLAKVSNSNCRPSSTGLRPAVINPDLILCCGPVSPTSGLSPCIRLTMATGA